MKLDLYEIAGPVCENDVTQFENVALRNALSLTAAWWIGNLFVPLKGARDGHDFIATAFSRAAATLSETEGAYIHDDVPTAFQRLGPILEKMQVDAGSDRLQW